MIGIVHGLPPILLNACSHYCRSATRWRDSFPGLAFGENSPPIFDAFSAGTDPRRGCSLTVVRASVANSGKMTGTSLSGFRVVRAMPFLDRHAALPHMKPARHVGGVGEGGVAGGVGAGD